jgi:uncharacterized protein YkwD
VDAATASSLSTPASLGDGTRTGTPVFPDRAEASSTARLEQEMLELINRDRLNPANQPETHGRALPLRWNKGLAAVARAHSQDMLKRGFFAHVNPDGASPAMRVTAAGFAWETEGENIATYGSVPGAEAAFMNESRFGDNHRANILNPRYTEVGVGIVQGPDGMYHITQEFVARPRDQQTAERNLLAPAPAQSGTLSGR